MNTPYFRQEQDHWCAPACLQMIFKFYGQDISQQELAEKLHTNEEMGTDNADIARVVKELSLVATVQTNAAWEDIQKYVDQDVPVIVNFIEASEGGGHFAVVVAINEGELLVHDPWNGESFHIEKNEFISRWKSGFENYTRWLLAVSH